MRTLISAVFLAGLAFSHARADPATIVAAEATEAAGGWQVLVTLRHDDTGWDDYADGWRVVLEGGLVLGTRTLLHPHVNEQPFTRSLSGVEVPDGVILVFIEASTTTGGWAGDLFPLALAMDR